MKLCSQSADLKFSCRAGKRVWIVTLTELKLTTSASNSCFQPLLVCHLMLGLSCVTCSSASAGSCMSFTHQPIAAALHFPNTSHVQPCFCSTLLYSLKGWGRGGVGNRGTVHLQVGYYLGDTEGYQGENDGAEVSSQSLGQHYPFTQLWLMLTSHRHLPYFPGAKLASGMWIKLSRCRYKTSGLDFSSFKVSYKFSNLQILDFGFLPYPIFEVLQ